MEVVRVDQKNFDQIIPMMISLFNDNERLDWAEATAQEMFAAAGEDKNAIYMFTERKIPLGYIAMEMGQDLRGEHLFIRHFYVRPEVKMFPGLGYHMEKFAVKFAEGLGKPRIVTAIMNDKILAVCEKAGYEKVSTLVEKWIPGVQNLNKGVDDG